MHSDHQIFIQAIQNKKKVIIKHRNKEGCEVHTKVYRPLFYMPASSESNCAIYYIWDGEIGGKGNILRFSTEQIIRIGQTQESFEPTGFNLVSGDKMSIEDSQLGKT